MLKRNIYIQVWVIYMCCLGIGVYISIRYVDYSSLILMGISTYWFMVYNATYKRKVGKLGEQTLEKCTLHDAMVKDLEDQGKAPSKASSKGKAALYAAKPVKLWAIQWTGDNYAEITRALGDTSKVELVEDVLHIHQSELGVTKVPKGHWIVPEIVRYTYCILSELEFFLLYEPVDNK